MTRRRWTSGIAVALVLASVAVLGPALAGASDGSVTIKNFAFGPTPVMVNVGEKVTWTNNDGSAHTATADDGAFDSGSLGNGQTFSHTFTSAGTFTYHCAIHPFMKGTIVVVDPSAPTTTTTTPGSTTTIPAPPVTTTTTTTPTTTPAPPAKPRLGSASLSHRRFHVARNATAFRFTLTAAANVKVAITHTGHGHRTVRDGSFTVKHLRKGKASVRFSGRIGRRALKPGTYRATLTAGNSAGSANPVRVAFTILR